MADPQQNYRNVLSRLEAEGKKGMSAQDVYDAASFLPGTGEAIAAYELPGILSQGGQMMQSDDVLEALKGMGLVTLGTASVAPGIGPIARKARKGLEGFIPYMGPKPAMAGGPDIDASIMKMDDTPSGGGSKMEVSDQEEFFEAMGEEGARLEYPRINDLLFKYEDRNNRKALETAFADPDYTQYKQVLDANLLRMFPDGKIPLQRITNYAEVMNEGAKKNIEKRTFDIEEIAFAGNDAERELIVNLNGDLRSFSLAKATDDINLGSGSLFSPETKKGRQLLVLSCSETKCPDVGNMEAVDRYLGPVFQSLKKQGVKDNVDVAILSAKHGLIRSDTKIQNYDELMSPKRASEFKQDPEQMNRIKNTLEGYDKVVVQGGKDYKDVIRAASGDANVTEVPGGRGIGDQRRSVRSALAFSKIDTPVFHYTTKPGFTKFDRSKLAFYDFGPHVASTPRAAEDRFISQVGGVRSQDGEIVLKDSPFVEGDKQVKGGSVPLQADLSKPFLNPKTNKPFTESELIDFKAAEVDKILKAKGSKTTFTRNDLLLETTSIPTSEIRSHIEKISKDLAEEGFTHVPYFNAYEDKGKLSFEMLVFDRPKGSTKVLQSPFAKKDPDKFDDADFMMEDGGVVSMKDKAVNMNRGPRGIEPFVQYFENGGIVQSIKDYIGSFFEEEPTVERNIFEEQRAVAERAKQDEIVQEGIDRFQAGLMMDRSFQGPGYVDRKMKRKGEYEYGNPFDPTVKDVIDEYYVLPDDVYVRKPKGATTYRSGVEFGDVELGFDLLNKMKFNPVLQAGLMDNRSLSDYVKYMKSGDPRARDVMGPGVMGSYNPSSNLIFLEALPRGENILPDKSEATLVHELMHKGAELLKRDRNIDLSFFKNHFQRRLRPFCCT